MELLTFLYLVIGSIFGLDRLSKVKKGEDSSIVCVGIMSIIALWPLYILYRKLYNENGKDKATICKGREL